MKIKEQPVVLEDPKTQVYLPVATTKTKGIASFDAKDFNVDPNGKVSLNENLHQIKENTDSALENSQEAKETADSAKEIADSAKETANEALEQVTEGEGTKIYENGVLQSSVNVDSDIQDQFDQLNNSLSNLTEDVEDIQELVPNQASAQNQLADKNFVNSSINAIAAFYITYDSQGNPFPTKAALSSATTFYSGGVSRVPTRNDYCLVLADETHDNASCRYVYSGEYPNGQWDFQFIVNETPFTSEQLAAINSGVTSNLVQQIPNKADRTNTMQAITAGALEIPHTSGYSSGYILFKASNTNLTYLGISDTGELYFRGYNGTPCNANIYGNLNVQENLNTTGTLGFQGLDNTARRIILDMVHPVNSIIQIEDDNFDPNAFYAGTGSQWQRLPDGYVLWSASSGAGQTIPAGLPNITGSFDTLGKWYNASLAIDGAFYESGASSSIGLEGGSGNDMRKINFNASRSSSIYGSSSTVQPPARKMCMWKRTA